MGKVVKTVFGGTDDSAQKSQKNANSRNIDRIERDTKVARVEAKGLFSASEQNTSMGFQAALDALAGAFPQQMQTFKAGNLGAQEALLAGLPQIQNALLGQNVSFTGLQPRTFEFDQGFSQQQLPDFIGINEALAGLTKEQPDLTTPGLQAQLSQGRYRGNL